MPEFRPAGDRGIEARLQGGEVDLLASLPEQLRELLRQREGRVHDRLFPRAYLDPTEEEAEDQWQRLVHDELLETRLAALDVLEESLERSEEDRAGRRRVLLGEDEALAWLGAVNDARLGLGAMLEVTEDLGLGSVPAGDARRPGLQLYQWLTWLQGELIEAMEG